MPSGSALELRHPPLRLCLALRCRQKVIISQRCVDIDKAVPQHMGISKAILENVIFVHQEEANWPLKESKVLVRRAPAARPASLSALSSCARPPARACIHPCARTYVRVYARTLTRRTLSAGTYPTEAKV